MTKTTFNAETHFVECASRWFEAKALFYICWCWALLIITFCRCLLSWSQSELTISRLMRSLVCDSAEVSYNTNIQNFYNMMHESTPLRHGHLRCLVWLEDTRSDFPSLSNLSIQIRKLCFSPTRSLEPPKDNSDKTNVPVKNSRSWCPDFISTVFVNNRSWKRRSHINCVKFPGF